MGGVTAPPPPSSATENEHFGVRCLAQGQPGSSRGISRKHSRSSAPLKAAPDQQNSRCRDPHVRGIRRGQHDRTAIKVSRDSCDGIKLPPAARTGLMPVKINPHVLPTQTAWQRRRKDNIFTLPGCAEPSSIPLFQRTDWKGNLTRTCKGRFVHTANRLQRLESHAERNHLLNRA